MEIIHTYKQPFKPDSLTFEMAKESGRIYSKALELQKDPKFKDFKDLTKEMEKYCKENTKYLHSQSAQGSYQDFITNMKSYFKALQSFKKNPKGFSGKPKPPRRIKFLYKITFKKSAIRYKEGYLLLSVKKPLFPIKIKWNENLPLPTWAIISYDRYEGWNVNFVMEKQTEDKHEKVLTTNNILSVDLGVKRVATTFNNVNEEVITYSGKELMSLTRLRNKVVGKIKSKKSKYKKKSRRHKGISRAQRKIVKRIKNKQKDIIHKYSRKIVDYSVSLNIGKVIFGDNSSTHDETNCGKNNQSIQQNPEQKVKNYTKYKFESVGGTVETVPEQYTSRTCPQCGCVKSNSPKGRIFICESCKFTYDRDGVGCVNIMTKNEKNVSFRQANGEPRAWLDVVGGLTPPKGVKYKSFASGLSPRDRIINFEQLKLVGGNLVEAKQFADAKIRS